MVLPRNLRPWIRYTLFGQRVRPDTPGLSLKCGGNSLTPRSHDWIRYVDPEVVHIRDLDSV